MSPRPGRISEIVDIDIERPRNLRRWRTPRFGELCDHIRTIFGAAGIRWCRRYESECRELLASHRLQSVAARVVIIAVWEGACRMFDISPLVLPSPASIAAQALHARRVRNDLAASVGDAGRDLLRICARRVGGLVIGAMISLIPVVERLVYPVSRRAADPAEGRDRAAVHHLVRLRLDVEGRHHGAGLLLSDAGQRGRRLSFHRPRSARHDEGVRSHQVADAGALAYPVGTGSDLRGARRSRRCSR